MSDVGTGRFPFHRICPYLFHVLVVLFNENGGERERESLLNSFFLLGITD